MALAEIATTLLHRQKDQTPPSENPNPFQKKLTEVVLTIDEIKPLFPSDDSNDYYLKLGEIREGMVRAWSKLAAGPPKEAFGFTSISGQNWWFGATEGSIIVRSNAEDPSDHLREALTPLYRLGLPPSTSDEPIKSPFINNVNFLISGRVELPEDSQLKRSLKGSCPELIRLIEGTDGVQSIEAVGILPLYSYRGEPVHVEIEPEQNEQGFFSNTAATVTLETQRHYALDPSLRKILSDLRKYGGAATEIASSLPRLVSTLRENADTQFAQRNLLTL